MKKILSILICFFILNSSFRINTTIDTNAKIKSVFIYNFTKYIEWPQAYKEGNFIIGFIGESSLYSELLKMAETKKVGNQTLDVIRFQNSTTISKCHVIYVCKDKSDELSTVLKKVKSNSTLVITEENGLADKGSGINFIIKENKQKFELNKGNVEKYKLKVSSNLESLAFTVK
ncbi:MAG: YfiR family protein [Flavobacteriales bacterium]|nr:YfiR family protein [Flavobacteriales bacterium]